MSAFGPGKPPFSNLIHIGMVVRDIEESVAHYQLLGLGPFKPSEGLARPVERKVRGKAVDPASVINKTLKAKIGDKEVEVVQPVAGQSPAMEFLQSKGEGINHLGFMVDDLEGEVGKLQRKGFEVIFSVGFEGGGGAAFFDIGGRGDILFELVQYPRA